MAGIYRSIDFVVCSTGLTSEQRRSLDAAVASLAGAEYDGNLTDRTTHLVAVRSAPMTEKLRAARRLGLPIVWPSWLLDAAATGSTLSPPEPHHVLQPLSGVVVCVSGPAFSAADRQAVRLNVEAVGGAYSSVLDASCTHIVLSGAPGHKYQSALAQDLSQVAPNAVFVTSTLSVGKASYRLDTLTGMRRHRAVAAALDESSTALPALMGPQLAAADAPPPPPGAGRPYSLRELVFAVRCARLSHADYFLACLTASIDPVLLLDKKLLFGAVFGAEGARAGTATATVSPDPADRLSQGPVSSATLAAMTGESAGPIAPGLSRAPIAVEGAHNSAPAPAEHMRLHERLQRAEEERAALLATVSMLTRQLTAQHARAEAVAA